MLNQGESNILKQLRELTDKEIAFALARRFDERLFGEIYRRYSRKIYLWCYNYSHDVEEAVDLSQEVFARIYQNISTYKGASSFSTWVYSITRNHCFGELSKKKREWFKRLKSLDGTCNDFMDDEELLLLDIAQDTQKLIEAAMRVMRKDEVEAFILHYRDGLTVGEITKILGCKNVTGARTLLQGARRKFKKLLKDF